MPIPLALPLAPLAAGGATAAAATFAAGTFLRLQTEISAFRGGPRSLPPVTGRETEATIAELIRDAAAGARLPVGFIPPEPQEPRPDLTGLAAAAAAGTWQAWQNIKDAAAAAGSSIAAAGIAGASFLGRFLSDLFGADPWGLFNSRPGRTESAPPNVYGYPTGTFNPNGNNTWTFRAVGNRINLSSGINEPATTQVVVTTGAGQYAWLEQSPPVPSYFGGLAYNDGQIWRGPTFGSRTGAALWDFLRTQNFRPDAVITTQVAAQQAGSPAFPQPGLPFPAGWTPQQINPQQLAGSQATGPALAAVPMAPSTTAPPLPDSLLVTPLGVEGAEGAAAGSEAGSGSLLGSTLLPAGMFPLTQNSPRSSTVVTTWANPTAGTTQAPAQGTTGPAIPGSVVRVENGTTQTNQQPGPLPLTPTLPAPANPTQTTPAGIPVPVAPAPVPITPVDSHFVNGVEIPAGSARADLASIATEMQRVEEKTAQILIEAAKNAGNALSLGDILNLLQDLMDMIAGQRESGSYTLLAPCDKDSSEAPIEKVADYLGGYVLDQVNSKLDAIALLLQHHKDLRQPVCDHGSIPGSNVTVQFTEVI